MFRNKLGESNKDGYLQSHLAMVLHPVKEEVRILGCNELYPVEYKSDDIRNANRDDNELESFNAPP